MKKTLFALVLAGLCWTQAARAVTINTSFGVLRDAGNTPLADGSLLLLIASDNASFGLPSPTAFLTEADDHILQAWGLDSATSGLAGGDEFSFSFNIGAVETFQGGENIMLLWFPTLTTAALVPGNDTPFGTFAGGATPALGDAWVIPGDNGAQISIALNTESYYGGPSTDVTGKALQATEAAAIPEPTTGLLVLASGFGLAAIARRRR